MRYIISAFPATGKSHFANKIGCHDSDSSGFPKDGFPENYMKRIDDIGGIILVSSHLVVRDALFDRGYEYSTCYPEYGLLDEYVERCVRRGSSVEFIALLRDNWLMWINSMVLDTRAKRRVVLHSGEYLSDAW